MIIQKHSEKGQATLELMLMMLALAACMVGILYVGAVTVSNNDRLLESKFIAEKKSRQNDTVETEKRSEYGNWRNSAALRAYLRELFDIKSDFNLPFGLDYSPRVSAENTLQDIHTKVTGSADSRLQNFYYWEETGLYNSRFSSSLLTVTDNAFNAAQLVSGHATRTRDDKDLDDLTDAQTRKAAKSWFGITLDNNDIRNNPSNHVFMPLIKKDKNIME